MNTAASRLALQSTLDWQSRGQYYLPVITSASRRALQSTLAWQSRGLGPTQLLVLLLVLELFL